MCYTFTLCGKTSVLRSNYFPPIELDFFNFDYSLGLLGFYSYNSIPNIDKDANNFYYGSRVIKIPVGAYDVVDIDTYLKNVLGEDNISITPNLNTLKCEINGKEEINFEPEDSIRNILGFSAKKLGANQDHESDILVQILKVSTIRVECNIVTNSYYNENLIHNLFTFTPTVGPGISISEEPRNIIYLPVNVKTIDNITITIIDQNGKLVNFRDELITVRLELRKREKYDGNKLQ